jgi:hypothetical protein
MKNISLKQCKLEPFHDIEKAEGDMRIISLELWKEEATKLFGSDAKNWKFKCSNCGHVQSIQDFIDTGIKEPETKAFFSCIGRWTDGKGELGNKKSPCN